MRRAMLVLLCTIAIVHAQQTCTGFGGCVSRRSLETERVLSESDCCDAVVTGCFLWSVVHVVHAVVLGAL